MVAMVTYGMVMTYWMVIMGKKRTDTVSLLFTLDLVLEFVFLFVAEVVESKQPTKGEKYDRVAGQMQNFAQLVLHCCTFGVAQLQS